MNDIVFIVTEHFQTESLKNHFAISPLVYTSYKDAQIELEERYRDACRICPEINSYFDARNEVEKLQKRMLHYVNGEYSYTASITARVIR